MPHIGQPVDNQSSRGVVAIGIFKLVKFFLLLGAGFVLVYWRDQDLAQVASRWIDALWDERTVFDTLVSKVSSLRQGTRNQVAVGTFIYSGLFLIEGIGLCCSKKWAEYLTIAITASLLPFEFYSLFRQLTATRIAITIVNIAILWYLVLRFMRDRRRKLTTADGRRGVSS